MSRSLLTALLAMGFLPLCGLKAANADFSGHWQIDPAQSREGNDKNISLDVEQNSNQITVTRVHREDGNRELTYHFTCAINGSECVFDENGHKAKVSLWYDGPELVMLKTNGPKQDPTVEWHLSLGTDGKTLTVNRENMNGLGKPEKLVFSKTESVASK